MSTDHFVSPEALGFPGHDYKELTVSSITEEKIYNPRRSEKRRDEYISVIDNLNLPDPKVMDRDGRSV
ncbi:MAG: hypothetical protein QNK31_13720 [Porticoccus sp.]|nr:hypothetical protein [Porticoccus sp.]